MSGLAAAMALGLMWTVAVRRTRRRATMVADLQRRRAALAPSVDLIAVVVGSGGTVAEAVVLLAEGGPPAARPGFAAVTGRWRQGVVLADALPELSAALGPDYHGLTSALIVSEQGGVPLSSLLQRLADEADQARRRLVDATMARLPVTLLVPLVACQLPAVIVGSVLPLAVLAARHLRG